MFKILIVEDDTELNKTVCSFLNHSGYEATGCLNANEAWNAVNKEKALSVLCIQHIKMLKLDNLQMIAI